MRWRVGLIAILAGCSGTAVGLADAGPSPDAGTPDAGVPDSGAQPGDAGVDAGSPVDGGNPGDGGLPNDGGVIRDAGIEDAGTLIVAWNGESVSGGAGWSAPNTNGVTVQSGVAHEGQAVFWDVVDTSVPWNEWGWNWKAWQKPGTDISGATTFAFYLKLTGSHPPGDMTVSLRSAITDKYAHQPPPPGGLRGVSLALYTPDFADGQWHRVQIPLADILSGEVAADFAQVYEIFMGAAASDYQLYVDDLEFR